MGILEKIAEIEREIARTQKNKGELDYAVCMIAWKLILFRQLMSYAYFYLYVDTSLSSSIIKNRYEG